MAARSAITRAIGRWAPLAVIAVLMAAGFSLGWHHHLSFTTLVDKRTAIMAFVAGHPVVAPLLFGLGYAVAVTLSLPGAVFLTIACGLFFGEFVGGAVAAIAATLGATGLFVIARGAIGEALCRRAGSLATRLIEGFRADAFSYLLFLRLVPAFPFWLVNLVPALAGVPLRTFFAATLIGVVPASFAFAFFGAGLDSVLAAEASRLAACRATGSPDCRAVLDLGSALTPKLVAAFVVLGLVALLPVLVKRLRARNAADPGI